MNILVAFDGSKAARKAVQLARKHAQAFDAKVVILCSMKGGPEVPRREFERAEKQLQSEELGLKEAGIPCESILSVRGMEPGEDILQVAAERKAEEIILGIQKKSKVGKLLFGSTAQYVILNAECPVVTVA